MDPHTVQTVTHRSWFGRLGDAFKGVLVGLLLFVAAFPLLFWNEGRAVRRHQTLEQGAATVVSVPSEAIDPSNDGQLVHVSGTAATDEVLRDADFAVEANALRLRRRVEMYQWEETTEHEERDKLGGGTETITTYEYDRVWQERLIDSDEFEEPEGHENPTAMEFSSRTFAAQRVRLGAYELTPAQVDRIGGARALDIAASTELPTAIAGRARVVDGGYYIGDPGDPAIGDLRVRFSIVPAGPVSIVAQQNGSGLTPYRVDSGTIELLEDGEHTAAAMFESAQAANTALTWVLRAVGCLVMFLGLGMIFRPLAVTADVIPILGNIVEAGVGLVAFLIALMLSLVTIGIAWIFYRPLIGGAVLAVAAVLAFVVLRRTRKAGPATA